jgi:hypothetical protein
MKKYNTIVSVAGLLMLLLSMPHGFAGDRGIEDDPVTINGLPTVRSSAENILRYTVDSSDSKQIAVTDNNTGRSVILSIDDRTGTVIPKELMQAGMDITISGNMIERIARVYRCLLGAEQNCESLIKSKTLSDEIKCMSDNELGRGNVIHMCIEKQEGNRITRCFVY